MERLPPSGAGAAGRTTAEVRIGCSGWQYRSWRGVLYPHGCPPSRWLSVYGRVFDTVEVNSTFYRLASPAAVASWLEQTAEGFVFAVKASRYLTHMRRLRDMGAGVERFYAAIAPLAGSPRLGPVLWQLPERFARDDERLADAIDRLPPGRHAFELRHPSWYVPDVYALLRERDAALVVADDPRRPQTMGERTAGWSYVRLHHGHRGRRGNYSESELRQWAERLGALRARGDVFAYLNNDWEAFAPRNARRLRALVAAGEPAG